MMLKGLMRNHLIIYFIISIVVLIFFHSCQKEEKLRRIKVFTKSVTDIYATSVTANGEIVDLGEGIIDYGHCYGLNPNPTVLNDKTSLRNIKKTGEYSSVINDLEGGVTYHIRAYAQGNEELVYGDNRTFITLSGRPEVSTSMPGNITINSAICGGTVISGNGDSIIGRGICWDTISNVSLSKNSGFTMDSSGLGKFTRSIYDLNPGIRYFVKAWAETNIDTSYGEEFNFTTLSGIAQLSTSQVTDKTSNTAKSGGNISSDGGASITTRGVCWSTTPNPTISNYKTLDGSGLGEYSSTITKLKTDETYYVRAYATNSVKTSYGDEISFSTKDGVASIITQNPSNITATSLLCGGSISDDGGSKISARGVCWSKNPNPTIADSKTMDGTGSGSYNSIVTGLDANTVYYFRAYATNEIITSYGTQQSIKTKDGVAVITTKQITDLTAISAISGGDISEDGGSTITSRGICWGTFPNPTISDAIINNGSNIGSFSCNIKMLSANTTYYVRAFAINGVSIYYGNQVSFTTKSGVPSIVTTVISNIQNSSAIGGGVIAGDGGAAINERGICWSEDHNPIVSDNKISQGIGTVSFSCNISNLQPNTEYFVRAYAINSITTSYGNEVSFHTKGLPEVVTAEVSGITYKSAQSGGSINEDWGYTITEQGVCWSTDPNPTIDLNTKTSDDPGFVSFISSLTGLTEKTKYYIRAYATNSIGTSYGNEISFTTMEAGQVTDIDGNSYDIIRISDQIWMGQNLKVTRLNDGTEIPMVIGNLDWASLSTSGYSWYNNDQSFSVTDYGILYNWYSVNTDKLCPEGWRVPSDKDWDTLTDYFGGSEFAGGKLKEKGTDHWLIPNTEATDFAGYSALPGGNRDYDGLYGNLGLAGWWWSSTEDGNGGAWTRIMRYTSGDLSRGNGISTYGFSVRCISNEGVSMPTINTEIVSSIYSNSAICSGNIIDNGGSAISSNGICWSTSPNPTISDFKINSETNFGYFVINLTDLIPNTDYFVRAYATNIAGTAYGGEVSFRTLVYNQISDIDGNIYNTITIGQQQWMAENLKTTKYSDGSLIPQVTNDILWSNLENDAFCWYNNSESGFKQIYGALYNWYAVNSGKLCPANWHVPSDDEWKALEIYLGLSESDANKIGARGSNEANLLKESGNEHWILDNYGASNDYGFTALPGGSRSYNGSFVNVNYAGEWWTASEYNPDKAWYRYMDDFYSFIYRNNDNFKQEGLSVRCIRDY